MHDEVLVRIGAQLIHGTSSPLPLAFVLSFLRWICMSSREPADSLAHDRLWSLIANTQPTNSHNIFEGALFHFRNTSAPTIKGRPPFKYTVYFYLLSCTCDANFTPFTYSLHSISLSVHLAHSHRSNINFTTSGYSLSTLPTHI